ncbi:MAG: CAP domain-containing protein [Candidatus Paceibacterota bacterium]
MKFALNRTVVLGCAIGVCILCAAFLTLVPRIAFAQGLDRASIIENTNADRVMSGVGTLSEDPLLSVAAQKKANDMAARGYFSHVDPNGRLPWYWMSRVGYWYLKAGENLAMNFTDAAALEAAWMSSPTHRANIVKAPYTRIGIGIASGTYQGRTTTFVVQFFATPAPQKKSITKKAPATVALAK